MTHFCPVTWEGEGKACSGTSKLRKVQPQRKPLLCDSWSRNSSEQIPPLWMAAITLWHNMIPNHQAFLQLFPARGWINRGRTELCLQNLSSSSLSVSTLILSVGVNYRSLLLPCLFVFVMNGLALILQQPVLEQYRDERTKTIQRMLDQERQFHAVSTWTLWLFCSWWFSEFCDFG